MIIEGLVQIWVVSSISASPAGRWHNFAEMRFIVNLEYSLLLIMIPAVAFLNEVWIKRGECRYEPMTETFP